jgi:hypothetical protein
MPEKKEKEPPKPPPGLIRLKAGDLVRALKATLRVAKYAERRAGMDGVYFKQDGGDVRLIGCCGHWMVIWRKHLDDADDVTWGSMKIAAAKRVLAMATELDKATKKKAKHRLVKPLDKVFTFDFAGGTYQCDLGTLRAEPVENQWDPARFEKLADQMRQNVLRAKNGRAEIGFTTPYIFDALGALLDASGRTMARAADVDMVLGLPDEGTEGVVISSRHRAPEVTCYVMPMRIP